MSAPSIAARVTYGDDCDLECPHCGELMNMSDDARWTHTGKDECEHCEGAFEFESDTTVYTTAKAIDP